MIIVGTGGVTFSVTIGFLCAFAFVERVGKKLGLLDD